MLPRPLGWSLSVPARPPTPPKSTKSRLPDAEITKGRRSLHGKMEIPILVRSLKSSILSSTSFQMDKTFWGVVSAAVEQCNQICSGRREIRPLRLTPESFQNKNKNKKIKLLSNGTYSRNKERKRERNSQRRGRKHRATCVY